MQSGFHLESREARRNHPGLIMLQEALCVSDSKTGLVDSSQCCRVEADEVGEVGEVEPKRRVGKSRAGPKSFPC